jgi:tRNA A37 threonylcarbamoyladenosine synthetase subunit TsaC/SUA5/YrdC
MADPPEVPGLEEACLALDEGRAVVVPNPSPMTYGIVATNPYAVNALKHRPPDQNVAVSLHNAREWRDVAPSLDLPAELLPRVGALLRLRLSLLVPLRASVPHPDWINPAVRDGYLAMFSGWWAPLARLWDEFPRLYGSSANRTGQSPAASAAEAVAMVGTAAPVVNADAFRDLGRAHAASSMVRVAPDGELCLYRRGANDAASGLDPEAYLRHLAATPVD